MSDSDRSKDFPHVHYYDLSFSDIYRKTWEWIDDCYSQSINIDENPTSLFTSPNAETITSLDSCFSTFFLVYSNRIYPILPQIDFFYDRQEHNGAIRGTYSLNDGTPIFTTDNPESLGLPLFSWVEYNLYNKLGTKKRIREIMPVLIAYFTWIEENFKDETGLYHVPLAATGMYDSPRESAKYLVDFNMIQALNALYMSELSEILNDKDTFFNYRRIYFSLKTKINRSMWNKDVGFYFDLDKDGKQTGVKTIAAFWSLIAELPNDAKMENLLRHLNDPNSFGTTSPFPSLAVDEPRFDVNGNGYCGSVFSHLTFMVIKGLERYSHFEFARSSSIRSLYHILEDLQIEDNEQDNIHEAHKQTEDGTALWKYSSQFPTNMHLSYVGLSTISLMIENIIGLHMSIPRKTVTWIVPTLESMGIENLSLKRNFVSIHISKSNRGWEIQLESEKLYYFTINILNKKRKTLPIPSGKCSMLVDKL